MRITLIGIFLLGILSQHTCSRYGQHISPVPENFQNPILKNGVWKFELNLGSETLPFYCQFKSADTSFTIINATEKIICRPVIFRGDSIFFSTPVFQNEFKLKRLNNNLISGEWVNYGRSKDYKLKLIAKPTDEKPSIEQTLVTPGQKWEIVFGTKNENYKAIGLFNYFEPETSTDVFTMNAITGTFITETGDYRFLEGKQINNDFTLSCFDGSHAFLFKGNFNDTRDSVKGMFYSGNHYKEPFEGIKNDKVHLRNPDSITYLKPEYKELSFTFPDINGKKVSFPSPVFENKVIIIDIMGSWCPNCMDATNYIQKLYSKYNSKGLEVLALCFERTADFETSVLAIKKMKNNLKADFPFLVAGVSNKQKAGEALPMLNSISSFPTTIIIDKKGVIRKIYTGFYGPSTGLYYNHYVEQTENFLEKLLAE